MTQEIRKNNSQNKEEEFVLKAEISELKTEKNTTNK